MWELVRVKRQLEAERLRRIMPQGVSLFKSLRRELQCLAKDSLGSSGLNKGRNRRLFCRIMWRAAILEVMMLRRKRNGTPRCASAVLVPALRAWRWGPIDV